MEIPFFSLERQTSILKPALEEASSTVFNASQYVSGSYTKEFEFEFCKYLSVKSCVSCGNATDGLELVLRAMGVGIGDEVVVSSYTWISDAEAVKLVGASPVFAEMDLVNFNLSAASVECALSSKTKAIIFTHMFGCTDGFEAVANIAQENKLMLIEDCAQAHGATVAGKKVGGLADAGVFSFYPTKNLGAYGDAGAVTTNDEELASKIRILANHGQVERDVHISDGRNSRMDELQAAFLLVKLKYLDRWNERRNEIALRYLDEIKGRLTMPYQSRDGDHVYHQFVVRSEDRNKLKSDLLIEGIGTAIHYPNALPFLDAYYERGHDAKYEASKLLSNQVLSLPIWPELSELELGKIIKSVNSLV